MAGQKINIQNKILLGTGTKPTIPNPSNINPDSEYWKDDTDILIGQWAYNATDNLWFTIFLMVFYRKCLINKGKYTKLQK